MDNPITADLVFNNGTTLKSDCDSEDCSITLKLIKATNKVSDPSSATWIFLYKTKI